MSKPSPHEVTQLLQAWSDGNQEALDKLVPLVYEELHRLARHYMGGERPGHTLQTTELVNFHKEKELRQRLHLLDGRPGFIQF